MPARVLYLVILAIALAACPRQSRKTLVADVPQSGSAEARARFVDARAKFLRDGGGTEEFRSIAEDFPDDPIVPWTHLYAGIAAVRDRKFEIAAHALEAAIEADADPGLTTRAELFLGVVLNYNGDPRRALPLLSRGARAIESEAERTEYLAAVAFATALSDRPLDALPVFDQLYTRVTPTERAVIVSRVEELVARADRATLARRYDGIDDRRGPSMAAIASRLALLADQAGATADAARLREVAETARVAVGQARTIDATTVTAPTGAGDPGLLGAVIPLDGKRRALGESIASGLGVAAGVADGAGIAAVELRRAGDGDASAAAVEELARANVVAIIGPTDSASVDAAGARAEALGVPLLSLTPAAEKNAGSRFVFHVMHSAEARSRALATRALAAGVTKFAVLAADSGYGRAMTAAFTAEVERGGGTIVKTVTYKPDTKSFPAFTAKLDGTWQAVFVPATADTLGLIAPSLAATGKIPRPLGTRKVIGGRPVLLLSTAENLTAGYLADAGRHSEGAMLAPGYYPDDRDLASKAFVDRYIASFGKAPGFMEAYAYDAAQLAAAGGAGGRAGLAVALATGELAGLTGLIRFDRDHRRADAGVIYTVAQETGGVFAIRVMK